MPVARRVTQSGDAFRDPANCASQDVCLRHVATLGIGVKSRALDGNPVLTVRSQLSRRFLAAFLLYSYR
jgi:hypothetical protein